MPALPYEKIPVAHAAHNAVANSGVSDAAVNAMTAASDLVTLISGQAATYADQTADYLRWSRDIQVAIDAGIYNDTNVGGATTKNALLDITIAIDPNLSRASQGGAHWTA